MYFSQIFNYGLCIGVTYKIKRPSWPDIGHPRSTRLSFGSPSDSYCVIRNSQHYIVNQQISPTLSAITLVIFHPRARGYTFGLLHLLLPRE